MNLTEKQFNRLKMFYSTKRNKSRLISMLKLEGEYLDFVEQKGYVYELKVGEINRFNIILTVAIQNGEVEVLNGFLREGVITRLA